MARDIPISSPAFPRWEGTLTALGKVACVLLPPRPLLQMITSISPTTDLRHTNTSSCPRRVGFVLLSTRQCSSHHPGVPSSSPHLSRLDAVGGRGHGLAKVRVNGNHGSPLVPLRESPPQSKAHVGPMVKSSLVKLCWPFPDVTVSFVCLQVIFCQMSEKGRSFFQETCWKAPVQELPPILPAKQESSLPEQVSKRLQKR
ncbi:uncharacterized protein ACIBXB_020169 isoform 1-T2 [Morphnus guianensis]